MFYRKWKEESRKQISQEVKWRHNFTELFKKHRKEKITASYKGYKRDLGHVMSLKRYKGRDRGEVCKLHEFSVRRPTF
jgi:hypothetical protein